MNEMGAEVVTVDPSWMHGAPALDEAPPPSLVPPGPSLRSTLDDIQREAILRALQSCDWIIGGPKGAAALLGLKRTTLQARIQKLGISAPRVRRVPAIN